MLKKICNDITCAYCSFGKEQSRFFSPFVSAFCLNALSTYPASVYLVTKTIKSRLVMKNFCMFIVVCKTPRDMT